MNMEKEDILNAADVQLMVDEFYKKVDRDELLSPVFRKVIQGDWQPHLKKMYGFWETILFNERKYSGSPFSKHIPLAIDSRHFKQWLALFHETIDHYFEGKNAEEVKKRSQQMGLMFEYKLKHINGE